MGPKRALVLALVVEAAALGNYTLSDPHEASMISVTASANYPFANLSRRPDPSNPRDRPNAAQFAIIRDEKATVPANENNLTFFKSGDIN